MKLEYFVKKNTHDPKHLIVFLHGLGSNGDDLVPIYEYLSPHLKSLCGIFPTAESIPVSINAGFIMPAWFDIESLAQFSSKMFEDLLRSSNKVVGVINQVKKDNPTIQTIDILGFSQGGLVALAVSSLLPVRSLLLLSTFYPGNEPLILHASKIFIAHGDQDTVVPYEWGKKLSTILSKNKELLIDFKTYKNMGHQINHAVMKDLVGYLGEVAV
jgi:predicted esterase